MRGGAERPKRGLRQQLLAPWSTCSEPPTAAPRVELCELADRSVDAIGEFARERERSNRLSHRAGHLKVSTTPPQDGAWLPALRRLRAPPGAAAEMVALEPRRDRGAVRLAAVSPGGAIARAAHRAAGAARPRPAGGGARRRGVASCERTRARRIGPGPGGEVLIETDGGPACAPAPRCSRSTRPSAGRARRCAPRLAVTSTHMIDHRAGSRPARGDRLDRGRVHLDRTPPPALLPHHRRRPDRLRLGRRAAWPTAPGSAAGSRSTPAVVEHLRAGHPALLPRPARAPGRRGLGRAGRRLADASAERRHARGRRESTTSAGSPATASAPRTWPARRSPRSPSTAATSSPARRWSSRGQPPVPPRAARCIGGTVVRAALVSAGARRGPRRPGGRADQARDQGPAACSGSTSVAEPPRPAV